jgi:hypothetical protein
LIGILMLTISPLIRLTQEVFEEEISVFDIHVYINHLKNSQISQKR